MVIITKCTQKQVQEQMSVASASRPVVAQRPPPPNLFPHYYIVGYPIVGTRADTRKDCVECVDEKTKAAMEKAMGYRKPKLITHYYAYSYNVMGVSEEFSCCLCPTCDYPLEREYVEFCCGCGQRLKWGNLRKLKFKEEPNFGECKVWGSMDCT